MAARGPSRAGRREWGASTARGRWGGGRPAGGSARPLPLRRPAFGAGEPQPRVVIGVAAGWRVVARDPSPFEGRRQGAVPPPAPMAVRRRIDGWDFAR